MRCEEVSRELHVPSGGPATLALQAHLDACPRCAAEALSASRLDRAWAATSPPEPGEATWLALWNRVADSASTTTPTPRLAGSTTGQARSRSWAGMWAFAAVAQAAAVLLAGWIFLGSPSRPDTPADMPDTSLAVVDDSRWVPVEYELDEGQTLFLTLDASGQSVVVRPSFVDTASLVAFDGETPDPYATAFTVDMLVLNVMEGLDAWSP